MKVIRVLAVAAVLFAFGAASKPEPAEAGWSFGYYGPRVGIYIGPRPYYYGYRRYYRPYYYRPYYYRPYYYRSYPRYYGYRKGSSRCRKWASRCSARWGRGGRNYRGCMRYHRC